MDKIKTDKPRFSMMLPNPNDEGIVFEIYSLDYGVFGFDCFCAEDNSNFAFPHRLVNRNRSIRLSLSNADLAHLMNEYVRYFGKAWE